MNMDREIAALRRMTVTELRARHIEVFGEQTRSGHKDYLIKRIAWRLQANAWGGLSERAQRRAEELARDADLRMNPPKDDMVVGEGISTPPLHVALGGDPRLPMPGAIIRRVYKGEEIVVRVLPKGFECDGELFGSLSAIAKVKTGSHWNGFHFFHLDNNKEVASA